MSKASNGFLRILFCSANPLEQSRLRLDEEYREIEKSLLHAIYRDRVELHSAWATTVQDLLYKVTSINPDIVHFSGHGNNDGINLEDKVGITTVVSGDALGSLFEIFLGKISCVVLNSCFSYNQAEAISRFVPFVIGSCSSLPDSAAIAFSSGFYKAVGAEKGFSDAFKLGIASIRLEGLPGSSVPKIITNSKLISSFQKWIPDVPYLISQVSRKESTKSLIVFDINGFTRINTIYGSEIADLVKSTIYEIVACYMRDGNYKSVYNWIVPFSDEFYVALWEDLATAVEIANDIRTIVSSFTWEELSPRLFVSISAAAVSYFPGEQTKEILIKGLLALKKAKANQANTVVTGSYRLPAGTKPFIGSEDVSYYLSGSRYTSRYFIYQNRKIKEVRCDRYSHEQNLIRELLRIRDFLCLGHYNNQSGSGGDAPKGQK